jgi:magnesium chelatase family protein
MVAKVKTFSFLGIDVIEIDVEVKITSGLSNFTIVGLPDKAVGESKERVRAAIISLGVSWPLGRIIVNLSPADLQKEGSHFDLAIALAILMEMGLFLIPEIDNYFVLGELSLDGNINRINGIISAAIGAETRKKRIICPKSCGSQAAWASSTPIIAAPNLLSLINHFKGEELLPPPIVSTNIAIFNYPDLAEVKGQENAKRALEIAAAGGHNLLMIGPPGTGKSMLAARIIGILPKMNKEEILKVNMIYNISGKITNEKLLTNRPFREIHHSCSIPAMIGGGSKAKPGEISLAHNGVLFLDELAEFPRVVLDSLRQPLESGKVTISRVNAHITYPANFQLITAMNPCRCGYLGDEKKSCKKAPLCGEEYKSKISGPLLDRIDIVIEVPQIDFLAINYLQNSKVETSSEVLIRVNKARQVQNQRYKNERDFKDRQLINSKIETKILEKYIQLDEDCQKILQNSVTKMEISMRGINRILRVARTIADLEDSLKINSNHLLEALSYRRKI